jgi:hypothetical protein
MKQIAYNIKNQASNNNRDMFKPFSFGKTRFHINKVSPYLLGKIITKEKSDTFYKNLKNFKELGLFNNNNIIDLASLNFSRILNNNNNKEILRKKKIKILYNINLYYRNRYAFKLIKNIYSYKNKILKSKNLKLFNLKKEQIYLNKRKGHTFLFGYDKYGKISNSYQKFFISEYRKRKLHLLFTEGL